MHSTNADRNPLKHRSRLLIMISLLNIGNSVVDSKLSPIENDVSMVVCVCFDYFLSGLFTKNITI